MNAGVDAQQLGTMELEVKWGKCEDWETCENAIDISEGVKDGVVKVCTLTINSQVSVKGSEHPSDIQGTERSRRLEISEAQHSRLRALVSGSVRAGVCALQEDACT